MKGYIFVQTERQDATVSCLNGRKLIRYGAYHFRRRDLSILSLKESRLSEAISTSPRDVALISIKKIKEKEGKAVIGAAGPLVEVIFDEEDFDVDKASYPDFFTLSIQEAARLYAECGISCIAKHSPRLAADISFSISYVARYITRLVPNHGGNITLMPTRDSYALYAVVNGRNYNVPHTILNHLLTSKGGAIYFLDEVGEVEVDLDIIIKNIVKHKNVKPSLLLRRYFRPLKIPYENFIFEVRESSNG